MAIAPSRRSQTVPVLAVFVFVLMGIYQVEPDPPTTDSCAPAAVAQPMAAVTWPPSTGLLVGEVVTGGGSASDEFVEIYNASSQTIDLAGLEIVYATSTGSTVTRKQTWTAFPLAAHAHLLLANSAGAFVAGADGLYSGGFSATGGSIVLRVVGGAVIDSLSWGDASSAFVEGTPGLAPPSLSSLERLPGGVQGNAADSNDNVADTWVNSNPLPQSSASAPVPGSSASPSVGPTSEPTPSPTHAPSDTPGPTPEPTSTPPPTAEPTAAATPETTPTWTPELTAEPEPTTQPASTAAATPQPTILCTPQPPPTTTATPSTTAAPSPTPTPTATPSFTSAPTANPSATPTATATATPTTAPTAGTVPIAAARTFAIGTRVAVRGVVTVAPGWILGDMTTAIQDDTAGIYVKLPQIPIDGIVPGRAVQVDGLLAAPFGNLEIRPTSAGVLQLDTAELPAPMALTINQLGESTEGVLAHVEGTIKRIEGGGVTSLTLIIEDATGEGRVFAHSTLGVSRDDFSVGQRVNVIGLVGDRLGLYRIWPRTRFDIVATQPDPTSTPSVTPRPTPRPTPTRTPAPTRTPSPSPRPSNAPGEVSISEALRKGGQAVTISGVATTGNGLLDADGQRVTFQDASGAILVRLPEGITARAGDRLRVTGQVGTYYNAPQLTATTATRAGDTAVQPLLVRAAPVAATLEWRLVVVTGTVESVHRDGDAWRAELTMPGGGLPIVGLERSGIDSTALVEGREATVTGIVKRAYPTASDQRFAVVPRTAADIKLGQQSAGASDAPGAPGGQGGSGDNPLATVVASDDPYAESSNEPASPGEQPAQSVPIAELSSHLGGLVSVGGVVVAVETARFTIDDGTGVAAVVLEGEAAATVVGVSMRDLLNVTGTVTQSAAGALEIRVDDPLAVTWLDVASPSAQIATGAAATVGTAAASTVDSDPATASATDTRLFAVGLLAVAGVAAGAALVASPSRRQRVREWLANAGVALKRRLSTLLSS